jgi:hypothetical protein
MKAGGCVTNLHYFNNMKLIKTGLRYLLVATVIFITSQQNSYAGGFPVRPGSLLLSPSVSYFFANKGWDSLRRLTPFASGGKFTSVSYSLYAEYGLTKRFTLVAAVPYVMNTYEDDNGYRKSSTGVTDLETGIRYYLANINYIYYFSIQGTFITPLYQGTDLGYRQNGAELKFSFAGSGRIFGKNYYFTAENGVRKYFGTAGALQDRYSGTFGFTLDRRLKQQVSVSVGGFYSTSSLSSGYNPKAVNASKNFAFNQASISYGYSFSRAFSLFLSAGTFINGRNTGNGSSASASFIIKPL